MRPYGSCNLIRDEVANYSDPTSVSTQFTQYLIVITTGPESQAEGDVETVDVFGHPAV